MTDVARATERTAECDALAARLYAAWAQLAALGLPHERRARLQRQLIAVCDASKAPGASTEVCTRRLDVFLAALKNAVAEES